MNKVIFKAKAVSKITKALTIVFRELQVHADSNFHASIKRVVEHIAPSYFIFLVSGPLSFIVTTRAIT